MNLRHRLLSAAVACGLAAPAFAADPSIVTFGTLHAMPEADAKARAARWLTAAGKMDDTRFTAIWAADKSVADKTFASIALGQPAAAAIIADARDITRDPPTVVPAVIADEADPFVKANLAAAYARALAGKKVYEEALLAVAGVKAEEVVDPSAFLFFKAVAEHSVAGYQKARKVDAVASLTRLLDDATDTPDRYKMVATLMFFDLQNWSKDDKHLTNIGKLMNNSGRRLDLARGGQTTQDIQKRILFRLDEKIKELENEASGNGSSPPADGPPGSANGKNPNNRAKDSTLPNTGPADGKVDPRKLEEVAKVWGTLPDAERVKVAQRMVDDAPAKYRPYLIEYFKALQNSK